MKTLVMALLSIPAFAQQGITFTYPVSTATAGDIACFTASNTMGNCPTSPTEVLGVFYFDGMNYYVVPQGELQVNFDNTINPMVGDIVCASATVAGNGHDNSSAPCSTPYIGIVAVTGTAVSTEWVDINISGSAGASIVGPSGPAGPAGSTGATGSTGPAGATGPTGATGATGPAGSNGTNGANGTNGNTVLSGTSAPTSGTGNNGDYYILNPATNPCLYGPKLVGSWLGACVSMVGPMGTTGNTGAQGPTGVTGPQGATGPTGPQGPSGLSSYNGQSLFSGSTPTVSSCGSSPSVASGSTNNAGTINVGTGLSVLACTLNFSSSFTNNPSCQFTASTSGLSPGVTSVSTSAVTVALTLSLGAGKLYYQCF